MKRSSIVAVLVIAGGITLTRGVQAGSGQLTAREAGKVVSAHAGEVRACYEKHAMKQRRATGHVRLDVLVRSEGEVARIAVHAPGVRGQRFTRCVQARASLWQFPLSRHPTEIQVPFLFQHTRPGA